MKKWIGLTAFVVCVCAGFGAGGDMAAAENTSIAAACDFPEARQFDFWIGEWEVTANGKVAGSNTITRIVGGCALQENWIGAGGSRGTSLNYYMPDAGKWRQVWVSDQGTQLTLTGGIVDGKMVLSGEHVRGGAPVVDRITWEQQGDGSVTQDWDVSKDGGETWETLFKGVYRKKR